MPESSPKKDKENAIAPELDTEPLPSTSTELAPVSSMEGIESNSETALIADTPVTANDVPRTGGEKKAKGKEVSEPWPDRFNITLAPFLSDEAIKQVKQMFLEGPEPPRVSDNGWGGRQPKTSEGTDVTESADHADTIELLQNEPDKEEKSRRGRERSGRGGRGGRGARGGARGGRASGREDTRKVLSNVRRIFLRIMSATSTLNVNLTTS